MQSIKDPAETRRIEGFISQKESEKKELIRIHVNYALCLECRKFPRYGNSEFCSHCWNKIIKKRNQEELKIPEEIQQRCARINLYR